MNNVKSYNEILRHEKWFDTSCIPRYSVNVLNLITHVQTMSKNSYSVVKLTRSPWRKGYR